MISTSIVSHRGICFEVFMVLRLLARHIVDRSGADRGKADHTPQHEGVTAMCVPLRTAFSFHHHRKQHDRLQSLARAQEAPTSIVSSVSLSHASGPVKQSRQKVLTVRHAPGPHLRPWGHRAVMSRQVH
jgi:hypothetical protein